MENEKSNCFHPGGLNFTEQLLEQAKLTDFINGMTCLDMGCGAGESVQYLREKGADCTGIDLSPAKEASCVQGNICQLPFVEKRFQMVLGECTLSVCGDSEQAIRECYRVLQPGGYLLLADVMLQTGNLSRAAWQEMLYQAGFLIESMQDVSECWKSFVIEQLWAGKTIADLWGGCIALQEEQKKHGTVGYFLLVARKPTQSMM